MLKRRSLHIKISARALYYTFLCLFLAGEGSQPHTYLDKFGHYLWSQTQQQQLVRMNRSQGLSTRISKVNDQLQKLAGLIENDKNLYCQTKEALLLYNEDESSGDSLEDAELQELFSKSKGFSKLKREGLQSCSDELESNAASSTSKSGLMGSILTTELAAHIPDEQNQSQTVENTVKKFHPFDSPFRKKKQSKDKSKTNSKVKNAKSQKFFISNKSDSLKKNLKKPDRQLKKSTMVSSQIKNTFKKVKKSHHNNKTTSHNRLNQSLKLHINLKKEAIMKITDLNLQKQHCQRESEYLRAAVSITQETMNNVASQIFVKEEEANIKAFIGRAIAKFFSQFFHEKLIQEDMTSTELQFILTKANYLTQYMIRLPDILKNDNTLCQERCRSLFEETHFIDGKLTSFKSVATEPLCLYLHNLHDYISFLLNNGMVRETKRRSLPFEFHSERPMQDRKKLIIKTVEKDRPRQYDSERKKEKSIAVKSGPLKRTNTHKILSPKSKHKGHK